MRMNTAGLERVFNLAATIAILIGCFNSTSSRPRNAYKWRPNHTNEFTEVY